MSTKRRTLFRIGAVLVLVVIAAAMMVIGRGHTVYLDNRSLDYQGQTYPAPYKVTVYVDGERVAKLLDKERGSATCIGQTFKMQLEVVHEKGDAEQWYTVQLSLPYRMDGIIVNLPAVLESLPREAWLSEFVQTNVPEEDPSTQTEGDDLGLGDDMGMGDNMGMSDDLGM